MAYDDTNIESLKKVYLLYGQSKFTEKEYSQFSKKRFPSLVLTTFIKREYITGYIDHTGTYYIITDKFIKDHFNGL